MIPKTPRERQIKHREKVKSNIVAYNEFKDKEMLRMREYRKQHKIRRENDENLQKQYRKNEKLKKESKD